MGTNYYLLRKTNYDLTKRLAASLGCTSGTEKKVLLLINGYVWNNKYYKTIDEMNEEYYQIIHIGKSSFGWRFLLCIYPTENPRFTNDHYYHEYYLDKEIKNLDDWIKLFSDEKNKIIDEDGNLIDKLEMLDIITKRIGEVKEDNIDGFKVINGLCTHYNEKSIYHNMDNYIIMDDTCTYDLVISGNDAESGVLFC